MLLNLKGIVMSQKLYIHKIDTVDIAQYFADFVQKEFKTIPPLMEWLKLVSERLGIVHMTHHSIDFGKIKQHYLWLSIDSNKSIILVGHQFEHNDNVITATVDFTDEQKSYLINVVFHIQFLIYHYNKMDWFSLLHYVKIIMLLFHLIHYHEKTF